MDGAAGSVLTSTFASSLACEDTMGPRVEMAHGHRHILPGPLDSQVRDCLTRACSGRAPGIFSRSASSRRSPLKP